MMGLGFRSIKLFIRCVIVLMSFGVMEDFVIVEDVFDGVIELIELFMLLLVLVLDILSVCK